MSFTTNVQSNIPILIGVVMFFAAGLGYLRWARSQSAVSTIKLLNEQINAQAITITRLEGENATLTAKLDEQSRRLNEQVERITNLTQLIQGVPAWQKLHDSIGKLERNADRLDQLIDAYPTDWMQQTMRHYRDTADIAAHLKEKDEPA